jgi:hypothetical protein
VTTWATLATTKRSLVAQKASQYKAHLKCQRTTYPGATLITPTHHQNHWTFSSWGPSRGHATGGEQCNAQPPPPGNVSHHCHMHITPCVALHMLARQHPAPQIKQKTFPHCMRDAFRLSALTVHEMRGSVERTAFICMHLCLCARACVCPDLLDHYC